MDKVRIDKWLWAARFFKTRSLAKQAIEGGKVHCQGQKVKASKEVMVDMLLTIRQGFDRKEVAIKQLSEQRRGAPEAALLYEETEASQVQREQEKQARGLAGQAAYPSERPTKKQRRQIHRFRNINDASSDDD